MNARRLIVTMAFLSLATWGTTQAASVSWITGTTPPAQWTIQPSSPGTTDTITFSGPTDVYSNSCLGTKDLGGTPQISVDPVSRVILLWFQGPVSTYCPMIYMPVCGLQGDFGPLAAGDWTFTSLSKSLSFEIRFTVGGRAMRHVDADAPGPVHDGVTWTTAFLTLQDALAVAVAGDEIVMAEGTYKPDSGGGITAGDRNASFVLVDGITVKGGYAGYGQPNPDERDIVAHKTVLDGDLGGNDLWHLLNRDDNSYHVVVSPLGRAAHAGRPVHRERQRQWAVPQRYRRRPSQYRWASESRQLHVRGQYGWFRRRDPEPDGRPHPGQHAVDRQPGLHLRRRTVQLGGPSDSAQLPRRGQQLIARGRGGRRHRQPDRQSDRFGLDDRGQPVPERRGHRAATRGIDRHGRS